MADFPCSVINFFEENKNELKEDFESASIDSESEGELTIFEETTDHEDKNFEWNLLTSKEIKHALKEDIEPASFAESYQTLDPINITGNYFQSG